MKLMNWKDIFGLCSQVLKWEQLSNIENTQFYLYSQLTQSWNKCTYS